MLLYEDAKRTVDGDGNVHYRSVDGALTVLNDGDAAPDAFLRTAIRWTIGSLPEGQDPPEPKVRYLVGCLDGVYCYIRGNQVILSKTNRLP